MYLISFPCTKYPFKRILIVIVFDSLIASPCQFVFAPLFLLLYRLDKDNLTNVC